MLNRHEILIGNYPIYFVIDFNVDKVEQAVNRLHTQNEHEKD